LIHTVIKELEYDGLLWIESDKTLDYMGQRQTVVSELCKFKSPRVIRRLNHPRKDSKGLKYGVHQQKESESEQTQRYRKT
jgi:hypothetical protein